MLKQLIENTKCPCGREHEVLTKEFFIAETCVKDILKEYLCKNGYNKPTIVCDTNTEKFAKVADFCRRICLDAKDLHANEIAIEKASGAIESDCDVLVAVGGGTIHDIARMCAKKHGLPFLSCPTVASVDGFCSSVAALIVDGYKKTIEAVAPKAVFVDLEILANAPMRYTLSGFGDILGKYVALTDWKIAHILTGEYYCQKTVEITEKSVEEAVASEDGILKRDKEAYRKLIEALLLSGIAMQMIGNSRPASGAEHHFAHLLETAPEESGLKSSFLHGERVGVGTLIMLEKYRSYIGKSAPKFKKDFDKFAEAEKVLGKEFVDKMRKENAVDCAAGVTETLLAGKWAEVQSVLEKVKSEKELEAMFSRLGMCKTLEDVGVFSARKNDIVYYSPLIRNRLTFARVLRLTEE